MAAHGTETDWGELIERIREDSERGVLYLEHLLTWYEGYRDRPFEGTFTFRRRSPFEIYCINRADRPEQRKSYQPILDDYDMREKRWKELEQERQQNSYTWRLTPRIHTWLS